MFGFLVFSIFCGLAHGNLYQLNNKRVFDANEQLVELVKDITDNLIYNSSESDNSRKVVFSQLISFNYFFVTDNTYPNKDNVLAYLETYKKAKKHLFEHLKLGKTNLPVRLLRESLVDYFSTIKNRVAKVSSDCATVTTEAACLARLEKYDEEWEKKCPGYTNRNAKLHKITLNNVQVVSTLTKDYLKASFNVAGFNVERYLNENQLQNAAGLIALSKEFNFFTLNDFSCGVY